MKLTRFVPLYAALVLALATMGAVNQSHFRHQAQLIDYKADLQAQIAQLRSQAALVEGPLAVAAWARSREMVPAPEVDAIRQVAYYPAPNLLREESGLEVRTIWR